MAFQMFKYYYLVLLLRANIKCRCFVSQVSEAVPAAVLRASGSDGGSLLPLRPAAAILPASRSLRRSLRILRRRLRGSDPGGDLGRGRSAVPFLCARSGLLPARHPLPAQPAGRR